MPFDYEEYQKKCNTLTTEQLHKEWENYTRQISGGATSTATSVLFSPLTGGISLVGLGLSAPRIHNARKKREIIEAGLQARGTTHNTRKRDVIAPMAVAGTLGGLTLGLAGPGADMIAGAAVGHGMEYAVSHAALDATGAVIEHSHDEHSKKKGDEKLKLQYQNFQQQYVQEQAQLQSTQTQLGPQPGLQVIPPAPQHSRPSTPQPGQAISNQVKNPQPELQIRPPIPQHSRPGTPQHGQIPQSQPQASGQDQKYDDVPVAAPHSNSISYQPASHQQQFAQSVSVAQPQVVGASSQHQPIQQPDKYLVSIPAQPENVIVPSYVPEKSAAYTSIAPQNGSNGPRPCPSPLPQYSSPESAPTHHNNTQELSAQTATSNALQHPQMHIDLPPAPPTMEEEILFLKARLIQLELEKREALSVQQPPPISNAERKESQPSLMLTPPSNVQTQEQSYYLPPPASPTPPPWSPSAASQQQLPPTQPQQYFPPPPPSPRPQTQVYAQPPPPADGSYTYNPQNYPPPPSPNSQQQQRQRQHQQQPQFQRHDSGYYSNAPTPSPSNRLSQSYIPGQACYPVSPQATGSSQHSHNPSISSYSQPSPMTPAPPPYFPGPPGSVTMTGTGKDYFPQGIAPSSPPTGGNPNHQGQSLHGTQGWQWGMSTPEGVSGQPNYGPPPPIPTPWRG